VCFGVLGFKCGIQIELYLNAKGGEEGKLCDQVSLSRDLNLNREKQFQKLEYMVAQIL
jgi:hypothetical protein